MHLAAVAAGQEIFIPVVWIRLRSTPFSPDGIEDCHVNVPWKQLVKLIFSESRSLGEDRLQVVERVETACLSRLNKGVEECCCFGAILTLAENPVASAYCKWPDGPLCNVVVENTLNHFEMTFELFLPVGDVGKGLSCRALLGVVTSSFINIGKDLVDLLSGLFPAAGKEFFLKWRSGCSKSSLPIRLGRKPLSANIMSL